MNPDTKGVNVMSKIIIYRNADCAKCAKFARIHTFFDWFHRVRISTEIPKTGPLRLGEIVVEIVRTGEIVQGAEAIRQICRNIPAYAILRPLLRVPAIARRADQEARGCTDGECAI